MRSEREAVSEFLVKFDLPLGVLACASNLDLRLIEGDSCEVTKLSASEASRNLSVLLARVLKGESIGIECEGRIVALRPVEDFEDATAEYGLEPDEVDRAFESVSKGVEEERKAGRLRNVHGVHNA